VDARKVVSSSGGMLVVASCAGCRVIGTKQSDSMLQKVERLDKHSGCHSPRNVLSTAQKISTVCSKFGFVCSRLRCWLWPVELDCWLVIFVGRIPQTAFGSKDTCWRVSAYRLPLVQKTHAGESLPTANGDQHCFCFQVRFCLLTRLKETGFAFA
jgi:hypothetical protein